MPEVSEAFLQQMLTTISEAASAIRSSASAMDRVTEELKSQRETIERVDRDNAEGREDAVIELKSHITDGWNARDKWLKQMVVLFGTGMTLATLLSVPLGRVVAAFFNIK